MGVKFKIFYVYIDEVIQFYFQISSGFWSNTKENTSREVSYVRPKVSKLNYTTREDFMLSQILHSYPRISLNYFQPQMYLGNNTRTELHSTLLNLTRILNLQHCKNEIE